MSTALWPYQSLHQQCMLPMTWLRPRSPDLGGRAKHSCAQAKATAFRADGQNWGAARWLFLHQSMIWAADLTRVFMCIPEMLDTSYRLATWCQPYKDDFLKYLTVLFKKKLKRGQEECEPTHFLPLSGLKTLICIKLFSRQQSCSCGTSNHCMYLPGWDTSSLWGQMPPSCAVRHLTGWEQAP